ncbi:MAG: hypothetical protein WCL00_12515, partial [Bacteroidota bacterium]
TGIGTITALPFSGRGPENKDIVRIRDYRQSWTITPAGKNSSRAVLEGFVDPAGSIPDWLINMLIVDSPFKIINGVKVRVEKK